MSQRAIEVVARAFARAHVQGRILASEDTRNTESRILTYVNRRWREHEADAKALLRSLKDQPYPIANAGEDCLSSIGALNAVFEAMAAEEER
jgi:hypothetical protein